jgi:acyl-CoA synthetase (AMP-forming)/AMP-acid ligase II
MLIHQFLETNARLFPDKDAVINLGKRLTYRQLDEDANRLANSLIAGGLRPGDRVGILVESSIDYIISFFAILKAGGVLVGLNTDTTGRILKSVLSDCSASGIIVRHDLLHHLTDIIGDLSSLRLMVTDGEYERPAGRPDLAVTSYKEILNSGSKKAPSVEKTEDDLATIMYTSGTTGAPKGVTLTHHNLETNTDSIVEYLELTPDDRVMDILPLYYSYGLSLLLTHMRVGGTIVIDTRFTFPNLVLETMSKEKATGFAGVPTTFAILMNRSNFKKYKWDHLRYLTQAGGPMAPALTSRLIEAVPGVKLYVMYGQTEASARLSYLEPEKVIEKLGSIGRAIPGVTLTVRDENGNVCPPGVAGEIVAQGENIMKGYWNRPEETQKVLHADGLHTGDLARCDDDGYLFIVGRSSEMIKSGAHRISPKEIEEIILEHEAVAETAVVGRRDPILGEAICAVVVLRDGQSVTEKDILIHCTQNLPAFKVPKYVQFAETLPKTQSGKVQRILIKEAINDQGE